MQEPVLDKSVPEDIRKDQLAVVAIEYWQRKLNRQNTECSFVVHYYTNLGERFTCDGERIDPNSV